MENGQQSGESYDEEPRQREKLSDSIWKPWYAKLWWCAIPIYWLPASWPTGVKLIDDYYRSNLCAYVSPFFIPLTAFLILAFGYLSRWLDRDADQGRTWRPRKRPSGRFDHIEPTMNSHDPASGWRWIHRRVFHRDR